MTRRRVLGVYRLFLMALTLAAIGTQLTAGLGRESFSTINFFSYFTILSNVIASLVYLITGLAALGSRRPERFDMLRGAATLYMTITGIVYFLLLRGLEASLQTPIPWINTVLHYVMPLAVLLDWLITPAKQRISFRRSLVWMVFPVIYVPYVLIRGAVINWYPYPFLNPANGGYGNVLATSAVIAVSAVVLAALLALRTRIGNR